MERSLDAFVAELAEHPEGFAGLFARMRYVVLLPLLELPYPEVCERLVPALTAVGVPEELARSVSLRQLIGYALVQGTPYWAGRAVEWIEAGFALDRELADAIARRVREKVWSQRLRHQAFGLVRRWERGLPAA